MSHARALPTIHPMPAAGSPCLPDATARWMDVSERMSGRPHVGYTPRSSCRRSLVRGPDKAGRRHPPGISPPTRWYLGREALYDLSHNVIASTPNPIGIRRTQSGQGRSSSLGRCGRSTVTPTRGPPSSRTGDDEAQQLEIRNDHRTHLYGSPTQIGVTARALERETGWRASGPALVCRTTVLLELEYSDSARRGDNYPGS